MTFDAEIFDYDEMMRWNRQQAVLSALVLDFHAVRQYLSRNRNLRALRSARQQEIQ